MIYELLRTHEERLPYGLWIDEKTNSETLFDRGYLAIATRTLERPWEIEIHSTRAFVSHTFEGWFYNDGRCPSMDYAMRMCCQMILSEFVSGLDVRGYLLEPKGSEDGSRNYLPCTPITLAEIERANQ